MRVIDMECNVPRHASADADAPAAPATAERPAGYGMANYGRIFRSRREGADPRPDTEISAYVKFLERVGIVRAVPFGASNDQVAELVRDYPVRIYSSMNYATDRPYDLGHPRHLDQVAIDFPELTIIGGLGGWPWVNEMVALVRRHPKLHLDTSAHRAKYLGQRGSGWEMLLQFGNTLIQDKVLVGLSAGLVGQPHETLLEEYMALPLKDSVKEKWLYLNAARVFALE